MDKKLAKQAKKIWKKIKKNNDLQLDAIVDRKISFLYDEPADVITQLRKNNWKIVENEAVGKVANPEPLGIEFEQQLNQMVNRTPKSIPVTTSVMAVKTFLNDEKILEIKEVIDKALPDHEGTLLDLDRSMSKRYGISAKTLGKIRTGKHPAILRASKRVA